MNSFSSFLLLDHLFCTMDLPISGSILAAKILDDAVMKSWKQSDDSFQHLHSQDALSPLIYHKVLPNRRLVSREEWQEHCKSQMTLPKSSDSSPPFLCYCLSLAAKNLLFASHLPHPIHTEKIMCPASSSRENWMSAHILPWMKITYPRREGLWYPGLRPYWVGWLILQPSGPGILANGFGVLHKSHVPGFNVATVDRSLSCCIILHSDSKAAFWLSDRIWHVPNIDSSGDFQVFYLCQVEKEQGFKRNKISMCKGSSWFRLVKMSSALNACSVIFCCGPLGKIRRLSIAICKIEIMIMPALKSHDYISQCV